MATTAKHHHPPSTRPHDLQGHYPMSSSLATRPAPHSSGASASSGANNAHNLPHIAQPAHDPMDTSVRGPEPPGGGDSGPPSARQDNDNDNKSTDGSKNASPPDTGSSAGKGSGMPAPPPAAAALHQPKIVQTAFIHKLYKLVLTRSHGGPRCRPAACSLLTCRLCSMLEDQNIQHLISWSSSADSFVMAPTPDFSKVLSYVYV